MLVEQCAAPCAAVTSTRSVYVSAARFPEWTRLIFPQQELPWRAVRCFQQVSPSEGEKWAFCCCCCFFLQQVFPPAVGHQSPTVWERLEARSDIFQVWKSLEEENLSMKRSVLASSLVSICLSLALFFLHCVFAFFLVSYLPCALIFLPASSSFLLSYFPSLPSSLIVANRSIFYKKINFYIKNMKEFEGLNAHSAGGSSVIFSQSSCEQVEE